MYSVAILVLRKISKKFLLLFTRQQRRIFYGKTFNNILEICSQRDFSISIEWFVFFCHGFEISHYFLLLLISFLNKNERNTVFLS